MFEREDAPSTTDPIGRFALPEILFPLFTVCAAQYSSFFFRPPRNRCAEFPAKFAPDRARFAVSASSEYSAQSASSASPDAQAT